MDTISVIRGLYQAHLSEHKSSAKMQSYLTELFFKILDDYISSTIPHSIFDGEKSNLLFDETDDGWYGVDIANTGVSGVGDGPVEYRVTESLGETSCELCHYIDGQTLPFQLLKPGLTAPPFHPNCMGVSEVLDRYGNVLFVVGRDSGEVDDSLLDGIQFVIDLLGLIPVVGEVADGVNALISLARGNYVDAALSAASMIPFVGWTSTGAKWIKTIVKHGDEIADVVKYADEAVEIIEGVAKYGDELAETAAKALREGAGEVAESAGKHFYDVAGSVGAAVKPTQMHHFATNKNSTYTKAFSKITDKYGLNLNDDWNKALMPHLGRHPNEYHKYILKQMKDINKLAVGDINKFLSEFEKIKKIILDNPDMLTKKYWQ